MASAYSHSGPVFSPAPAMTASRTPRMLLTVKCRRYAILPQPGDTGDGGVHQEGARVWSTRNRRRHCWNDCVPGIAGITMALRPDNLRQQCLPGAIAIASGVARIVWLVHLILIANRGSSGFRHYCQATLTSNPLRLRCRWVAKLDWPSQRIRRSLRHGLDQAIDEQLRGRERQRANPASPNAASSTSG